MRAAYFHGPGSIDVVERPDPVIVEPTDAVVRVVMGCVCGSDLWYWRGVAEHAEGSIGHEFIGVVTDVGSDVTGVGVGDLVIAPFIYSDMSCPHCHNRSTISCVQGGTFGNGTVDGGQGEAVRVPLAGSTLVPVPGSGHSDELLKSLLSLSDVMSTGHHAAVSAGVAEGDTVAVVGDGAVGLSAVLAASRLGAERIIALSRNPARQEVALAFGATDIVEARATKPTRWSSSSPAASASTPRWSASAPTSRPRRRSRSPGPVRPSASWVCRTTWRSRSARCSSATSGGAVARRRRASTSPN
jgi:threonine dehydrogenase-like Zn-dependent dehydrogenase